jgi:hypothetical protein
MATKYGPRKKHNSGTVRTSTNNQGGSRTRKTVTTKTGNFTRSRSVNRNGTVKLTTTHKSPAGWITRTSQSIGSKPSKPKAPKFIKATPFKAPKFSVSKPKVIKTNYGSARKGGRGRRSSGGDDLVIAAGVGIFVGLFYLIGWIFKTLYRLICWSINRSVEEENSEIAEQVKTLTDSQRKILIFDVTGKWVKDYEFEALSEGEISPTIQEFLDYDWENFDFNAWKEENGFDQDKT